MSEELIGKEIIRGHIDTIILGLLSDQDRYGYEVYKEVLSRSGGEYELKEPSLYSAFRRLEGLGWVSSYWGGETQGGRRKYYSLTAEGRTSLDRLRAEWFVARRIIDRLIGE